MATLRCTSRRPEETTMARTATAPVNHPDRFFIGGEWVAPSSDATIDVIDSGTEELFFTRRRGAGRRHGARGRRGAHRVRRGPVAAADARGARRVPARARGRRCSERGDDARPDLAARVGRRSTRIAQVLRR